MASRSDMFSSIFSAIRVNGTLSKEDLVFALKFMHQRRKDGWEQYVEHFPCGLPYERAEQHVAFDLLLEMVRKGPETLDESILENVFFSPSSLLHLLRVLKETSGRHSSWDSRL